MKYLIPRCNFQSLDNKQVFYKGATYCFEKFENNLFCFEDGQLFCLNANYKNLLKATCEKDEYYFLFYEKIKEAKILKFVHSGDEYFLTVSSNLLICWNNQIIKDVYVGDVEFSHTEIVGKILIIYFIGERNFVLMLEQGKVLCADFYDEFNFKDNTKLFLSKQYDSLNHGRVYKINNNKFETYLVYLDDEELNLKKDFIANVFLDCLIVGNYKYCNQLLDESIKQKNAEDINLFFPHFDYFYIVENVAILTNKNALAGIYKFEISNLKIANITQLHQTHC